MDMTKFESEDDDGFTQVAGELRRCLKKLEEKRGKPLMPNNGNEYS